MTPEIERHVSANMSMSKKQIMMANFLGGLAWGFGTVVGASLVVAALGYVLNIFGVFEIFKGLPQVPQGYK